MAGGNLEIGETLGGRYRVAGILGRGGMGAVYRATDDAGRAVAVKLLLRPDAREAIARFDRERRLLAELADAGFVPLLDAGETPHGPFIVMPLVTGGTLRDRLRNGPFSHENAIALGIALATALGRAHALGVIHRDLKPENILYDGDRPLVADLGLAKHFRHEQLGATQSLGLSRTGEMRGTAGYMAPEQVEDAKSAGPPSDVFAIGAIVYEALAGQPAFTSDSLHGTLAKVMASEKEPLRLLRRDVPSWLEAVVDRALARDPRARFEDGAALAAARAARGASGGRGKLAAIAGAVALASIIIIAAVAAKMANATSPARATVVAPKPVLSGAEGPSERATPLTAPTPRADVPDWFSRLAARDRPALPLAKGLRFGDRPGEYVNEKDASILLFVPAGSFDMGAAQDNVDATPFEKPRHRVVLSSYFIGKLEVSNRQFARFVSATGTMTTAEREHVGHLCTPGAEGRQWLSLGREKAEASWRDPQGDGHLPDGFDDHPVVQVTWDDAKAYCAWAGLALPTEAQWERAAGWDTSSKPPRARYFPYGDTSFLFDAKQKPLANLCDAALARLGGEWASWALDSRADDGYGRTAPVGSFPLGASPVGALDMAGNVGEMCEDFFGPSFYETAAATRPDPLNTAMEGGTLRQCVGKGASWYTGESHARTSARVRYEMTIPIDDRGFRVALDRRVKR